jgi:hypothetical protein
LPSFEVSSCPVIKHDRNTNHTRVTLQLTKAYSRRSATEVSKVINCENRLTKKTAHLGFKAFVRKPCRIIAQGVTSGVDCASVSSMSCVGLSVETKVHEIFQATQGGAEHAHSKALRARTKPDPCAKRLGVRVLRTALCCLTKFHETPLHPTTSTTTSTPCVISFTCLYQSGSR